MLNPASLSKAPKAIKHAAKGNAGLLAPFKDFKPRSVLNECRYIRFRIFKEAYRPMAIFQPLIFLGKKYVLDFKITAFV